MYRLRIEAHDQIGPQYRLEGMINEVFSSFFFPGKRHGLCIGVVFQFQIPCGHDHG